MDPTLPKFALSVLKMLARFRGACIDAVMLYLALGGVMSIEACRKRLERLAQQGFLVTSKLSSGSQLFRLSRKGAQLVGAPTSFADPPTQGVLYDMLASSAWGAKTNDATFLTREEFLILGRKLHPVFQMTRWPGRFVLREITETTGDTGESRKDYQLHFWLAEFKPADQLVLRIQTIIQHLSSFSALFKEAMELGVFGITVAVPSAGVKATLEQNIFSIPVSIVVVEELATLVAKPII